MSDLSSVLMQALNFNKQDLEMNKSGILSESQKRVIQEKYAKSIGMMKKVALGILIIIPVVYFRQVEDIKNVNILHLLALLAFSLVYYLFMTWLLNRKKDKVMEKNYQVETLSGPIQMSVKSVTDGYGDDDIAKRALINMSGMKIASTEIKIDGKKIYLDDETARVFEPGKTYTFYCIKENGRYIPLSVEVM